jgi:hypothetical protein
MRYSFFFKSVQTGSGAHPDTYPMDTEGEGAFFSGINLPGREADHSPPSTVKVKNDGAIPPLPHTYLAFKALYGTESLVIIGIFLLPCVVLAVPRNIKSRILFFYGVVSRACAPFFCFLHHKTQRRSVTHAVACSSYDGYDPSPSDVIRSPLT